MFSGYIFDVFGVLHHEICLRRDFSDSDSFPDSFYQFSEN